MAMTSCRECKGEISTSADSCPKCGARRPIAAKGRFILFGLFALVALATLGRCNGSVSPRVSVRESAPAATILTNPALRGIAPGSYAQPAPDNATSPAIEPTPATAAVQSPPTDAESLDVIDHAMRLCRSMEGTGLTIQCEVQGWGSTVDATIDTNATDARTLCLGVAELMAKETNGVFAGKWNLRIFSPYNGARPIAICPLR